MKNMKKKALMAASYVAVAALAIGGTFALLTDDESTVNISTMGGGVNIELIEQQRSEDGSELVDFVQGAKLIPAVGSAQGEKDKWGMSADIENYVDKIVTVKNTGINDAYVRVLVAVPAELDNRTESNQNILHWNYGNNFTADADYNGSENPAYSDVTLQYKDYAPITIDGVVYNLYNFTYETALEAGETTEAASMVGFYLDSNVDYDDETGKYTIGDEVIDYNIDEVYIPVYAQAVQASGFDSADEAFEAAKMPINPWGEDFEMPTLALTAADLTKALEDGGEIVLGGESTMITDATTLNLNSATISANRSDTSSAAKYSTLTVASEVTIEGEGTVENSGGYGITVKGDKAELTINGGTYKGGCTAINVVQGDLIITGGTFEDTDYSDDNTYENGHYLINCIDANYKNGTATVTITGGKFKNWNPNDNASEGSGTDFVPEGYIVTSEVIDGDTWYTVVAE